MQLPELIQDLSENGLLDVDSYEAAIDLMQIERLRERINGSYVLDQGKLQSVLETSKSVSDMEKETFNKLSLLSSRERQCFLKHSIENKSFQKVADDLGISKSSVNQYIVRARKKITGNT